MVISYDYLVKRTDAGFFPDIRSDTYELILRICQGSF